jgi:dTDP-4-dehydro-6-deoxy-alpha-D-glucopyranose 2,3-dehydratase
MKINQLILKSSITFTGESGTVADILEWVKDQRSSIKVNIRKKPLHLLKNWNYADSLSHSSGGFFSVEGVRVKSKSNNISDWDQPIINQAEIGILGIIAKEINGILYFLMQTKIEPGNINYVQISPTIQATLSNFKQLHGGKKPAYVDYFDALDGSIVILDQLQSEHASRFIRKRNRNIVVLINDDISVENGFKWLTLGQINKLMQIDNLVNMDSRSIISCLTINDASNESSQGLLKEYKNVPKNYINNLIFNSMFFSNNALHSFEKVLSFITKMKCNTYFEIKKIPLKNIRDWNIKEDKIYRNDKKHFQVIGLDIQISNREVSSWNQPIIEPTQKGLCGLICKEFDGTLHFLVQAKIECGNFDLIEFGPTVQTLLDNDRVVNPYADYIINSKKHKVISDVNQSEEGGRFYQEQNQNIIILADQDFNNIFPESHIWMTLNQLKSFLVFNNFINIQLRSLISMLHIA